MNYNTQNYLLTRAGGATRLTVQGLELSSPTLYAAAMAPDGTITAATCSSGSDEYYCDFAALAVGLYEIELIAKTDSVTYTLWRGILRVLPAIAATGGSVEHVLVVTSDNEVTLIQSGIPGKDGSFVGVLDYILVPTQDDSTSTISLNTQRATNLNLSNHIGVVFGSVVIEDATSGKVSTAELWLTIGGTATQLTWPSSLIWLDGSTAPSQLNVNTRYCFIVRQEADGQQLIKLNYYYSIN